jgi:predicted amidohydrolase
VVASRRLNERPSDERTLRVACVQLATTTDRDANVAAAAAGVTEAAERGARFVALPEKWAAIGEPEVIDASAEPLDGPTVTTAREWASMHGIWLLAGSVVERIEGQRHANTSLLIAPDGQVAASYRKIHMFDVDVAGVQYRESDVEQGGSDIVTADVDGTTVGMTVCYDLRFPELYRILAVRGARIVTVPAAFTERTGRDHWEVLLRARAIENQCFVVAPNAFGDHGHGKVSYGRSMIVDPWGVVLAQAPDGEAVIVADLDLDQVDAVRAAIPSLASRVPAAYAWDVTSA